MTGRRASILPALLLAAGCVDIDVQRIGPDRPSRPPGCSVVLFVEGRPPYQVVDVATANVSCSRNRDRCFDALRKQACVVGADTVYDFSERTESLYFHITARFATRAP